MQYDTPPLVAFPPHVCPIETHYALDHHGFYWPIPGAVSPLQFCQPHPSLCGSPKAGLLSKLGEVPCIIKIVTRTSRHIWNACHRKNARYSLIIKFMRIARVVPPFHLRWIIVLWIGSASHKILISVKPGLVIKIRFLPAAIKAKQWTCPFRDELQFISPIFVAIRALHPESALTRNSIRPRLPARFNLVLLPVTKSFQRPILIVNFIGLF